MGDPRLDEASASRLRRLAAAFSERSDRQSAEIALLTLIDEAVVERRPVSQVHDLLLDRLPALLGGEHACIYYRVGGRFRHVAGAPGLPKHRWLDEGGTLHRTLEGPDSVLEIEVDAASPDPLSAYLAPSNSRFAVSTKIGFPDSRAFAVLVVAGSKAFGDEQKAILERVARQLSIAYNDCPFLDTEKIDAFYSRTDPQFFDGNSLRARLDVADLALEQLVEVFHEIIAQDPSVNHLAEPKVQVLFPREGALVVFYSTDETDYPFAVSIDHSVSGRAVRSGLPQIVADVRADPDYAQVFTSETVSEVAAPLKVGMQTIGVLNVESGTPGAFEGYPAFLISRFAKEISYVAAFARIHRETAEALEQRTANEIFIALGLQSSNLVHALNSSIGAMKTAVDQLRTVAAEGESLEEGLDLLDFVVQEAMDIPVRVRSVFDGGFTISLNDEVLGLIRRRYALDTSVTIELMLDDNLGDVSDFMVPDMLANLIDNAVRAARASVERPLVQIATQLLSPGGSVQNFARVLISDNGPGMDASIIAELFEPKVRDDREPIEAESGMGLGLFLSRKIVVQHGGDISVVYSSDRGTQFEITLPVSESVNRRDSENDA